MMKTVYSWNLNSAENGIFSGLEYADVYATLSQSTAEKIAWCTMSSIISWYSTILGAESRKKKPVLKTSLIVLPGSDMARGRHVPLSHET